MLRMSKLADYATVVMTLMAQVPEQVRNAPEIAAAVGLELPTVSKILKSLVRTGLLLSQRGPKGGYKLARQPEAIPIADIIDAIEGYPMGLTECSSIIGLCSRESSCAVRTNWQRISREIRLSLERITLAELAQPQATQPAVHVDIENRSTNMKQREASM
ncbi:MAG TPA: SUF system Fe-S cluster assembly regulator [Novimethylophilus sp.]|jgi:FeS assembly SUF system regulator|uniref:SUF system Fe-S cluster assembly regulator n=1 Tax=Novimethylophilus sp. TaxID=2137426 RepID=UPI002F4260D9